MGSPNYFGITKKCGAARAAGKRRRWNAIDAFYGLPPRVRCTSEWGTRILAQATRDGDFQGDEAHPSPNLNPQPGRTLNPEGIELHENERERR